MSRDDEIAVVRYKGRYYVYAVAGQNWILCCLRGKSYATRQEAIIAARSMDKDIGTEYGVRIYNTADEEVYRELAQDTRWNNELTGELKSGFDAYSSKTSIFNDSDFPAL